MSLLKPFRFSPLRLRRERTGALGKQKSTTGKSFLFGAVRKGRSSSQIGKHWQNKPAVIVYRDGRERCNPGTPEGCAEYAWRKILLWVRQYCPDVDASLCCVCRLPITLKACTFEHEAGRGGGKIDERLWNPETHKPINGVSHLWCNLNRGSSRSPIFHGCNYSFDVRGF